MITIKSIQKARLKKFGIVFIFRTVFLGHSNATMWQQVVYPQTFAMWNDQRLLLGGLEASEVGSGQDMEPWGVSNRLQRKGALGSRRQNKGRLPQPKHYRKEKHNR